MGIEAGGAGGGGSTNVLPTGAVIGSKYRIEQVIGAGNMGTVYRAVNADTSRRVALKVLPGELVRDDLVVRFRREAHAAGSIETQHVTQVLDSGIDETTGLPFVVMELLQGEDLQHLLKRMCPLPPELALRVVAQACLGLQKAHDAGVIHRDIKPANLFLARRDAGEIIVKLLDFGIAKIDNETTSMTRTGSMLGSPLYMSPEQALGRRDVDQRTDVWSIGVVLYQALCGRTPHHHIDALGELTIAICQVRPRPVQEFAPWVPGEVAQIVDWALRLDRNERFQTAQAMFQEIKKLVPYGWNIGEEMLVPLTEGQRMMTEPVLSISQFTRPAPLAMATGRHPAAQSFETSGVAPSRTASQTGSRTPAVDPAGTASTMARTQGAPMRNASRAPIAASVLAALALLAGGGVYYFARTPKPPREAPQTAATPAPAPPPQASADPTVKAVAEPADRHFKLVVIPPDALVEVDGVAVIVKNGIIELSGPLGATRMVRVSKGVRETIEEVAITESGLLPPKIEIDLSRNPSRVAPLAPSAGTVPATPGAASTALPPPGIKTDFK